MPDLDPLLQPTPPASGAAPDIPPKLCLLILFNHRFEANLPKLDWLYRPRFEHIRYLMPFYRGDRADVISVHGSSYQFQGYFMEAWKRLRGEGFTHFLICADDMLLNPRLTDKNFFELLGLESDSGFNKSLLPLAEREFHWSYSAATLVSFAAKSGVNWQSELPPSAVAAANLEAKGYPTGRFGRHNFRRRVSVKSFCALLYYVALRLRKGSVSAASLLVPPYPLLVGNADLLLVPAAAMEKFTHYCAVFAAMGIFVEVAAPTALALACARMADERKIGWIVRDCLAPGESQALDGYDFQLDTLLARYEERVLCIHPIKISQWRLPESPA